MPGALLRVPGAAQLTVRRRYLFVPTPYGSNAVTRTVSTPGVVKVCVTDDVLPVVDVAVEPSPQFHVYFTTLPPGNGSLGLVAPNGVLTPTEAVVGAGLIVKSGPTLAKSVIELGVPS